MATLALLLLLAGLGVDFLLWAIRLSKGFSIWNIFLNFVSATLTLIFVSIVADPGFRLHTGVYLITVFGIVIPATYWHNFGHRMVWLHPELIRLKRQVNGGLIILSVVLLVGALYCQYRGGLHQLEVLFLGVVIVAGVGLAAYVSRGWPILLGARDPTSPEEKGDAAEQRDAPDEAANDRGLRR